MFICVVVEDCLFFVDAADLLGWMKIYAQWTLL